MSATILKIEVPPEMEAVRKSSGSAGTAAVSLLSALRPADLAHLIYLALISAVLVGLRARVPAWFILAGINLAVASFVLGLGAAHIRFPRCGSVRVVRAWYHLPVFLILFEEVHWTVRMAVPGWMDAALLRFELGLLGRHPTVWIEQFASVPVTEYMNFAYFSYFLLIPAGALALWRAGRADKIERLFFACAVGYYVCYVLFHLVPIEGPYYTLDRFQQGVLRGGSFAWLMEHLEGMGRIHGGAFPSAHVTAATVVLAFTVLYARKALWILAPIVVSLDVSTVYLRYHYASDVVAGTALGLLACWAASGFALRTHARSPARGRPRPVHRGALSAGSASDPAPASAPGPGGRGRRTDSCG